MYYVILTVVVLSPPLRYKLTDLPYLMFCFPQKCGPPQTQPRFHSATTQWGSRGADTALPDWADVHFTAILLPQLYLKKISECIIEKMWHKK